MKSNNIDNDIRYHHLLYYLNGLDIFHNKYLKIELNLKDIFQYIDFLFQLNMDN